MLWTPILSINVTLCHLYWWLHSNQLYFLYHNVFSKSSWWILRSLQSLSITHCICSNYSQSINFLRKELWSQMTHTHILNFTTHFQLSTACLYPLPCLLTVFSSFQKSFSTCPIVPCSISQLVGHWLGEQGTHRFSNLERLLFFRF